MGNKHTRNRQKLQFLLRDLFQFDAADLDFGIYRILNQKRADIERFIERDLLDAVIAGLAQYQQRDREELEEKLVELRQQLGPAIDESGAVKEEFQQMPIAQQYAKQHRALQQLQLAAETEARIFNDLVTFFSRYYDNGDFLSKRRYSARGPKYVVPYNGEEVLLHWANRDQYYVKSSERFADYRFTSAGAIVWFRLTRAQTPQNNNRGESRYFTLRPKDPLAYSADAQTLTIHFEYRPLTKGEEDRLLGLYNAAQSKSNRRKTVDRSVLCFALEQIILEGITDPTLKSQLATVPSRQDHSLLGRHLNRYTTRNTMDYFVHKDLGGFLRQELDFFLKNEMLHVDDIIDDQSAETLQLTLTRMRVVSTIAEKIISFLAQIEGFQKQLFEKRKFVVQTDYCLTLDRVPEVFYPEILTNQGQLDAWRDLYRLDEWPEDLFWRGKIDETFLQHHPYLMVDTAFFGANFKARLLSTFEDLDSAVNGLLLHSENFQALNLLSNKYRGRVNCVFIDPPYNTGGNDFLYKDNYQHSSWISMMHSRLQLASALMSNTGTLWITTDDTEAANCRMLGEQHIPQLSFIAELAWEKVYSPRMDAKQFSTSVDTVLMFAKQTDWRPYQLSIEPNLEQFPHIDEHGRRYRSDPLRKWGKNSLKEDRPNLWYPIPDPMGNEVWPIKPDGREGCWRWGKDRVEEYYDMLDWLDKGHGMQPYLRQYADESTTRPPETLWTYKVAGSTHEAQEELKALFPGNTFSTPKPTKLVIHAARIGSDENSLILDFFAGSGTSAHAVMKMNRENNSDREYILVEMGDYFETILKPRIQKVAFTANWKNGVPQDENGQSHMFKYQRLESYEDALNNIRVQRPEEPQRSLLYDEFDDYMLHYMLDFETKDSPSLITQEAFENPFAYKLLVQRGHETPQAETVDLIETFNYLIGLHVRCQEQHEHQDRQYHACRGEVITPQGIEKVVVVWRSTEGLDLEQEADWANEMLLTEPVDRVYVNGPSRISGAEPLEITFRDLMEGGASGQ